MGGGRGHALPPLVRCGIVGCVEERFIGRKRMRRWCHVAAVLVLTMPVLPAAAQDYPTRSIRVIASQGPGGLSDIWMRAAADEMGPLLGQTVVVEDRVGAAGTIGARACGEAAPDGYTFCIIPVEAMAINPIINPVAGFDPRKSLVPVSKVFYLTQVFAVNADLGAKNFNELIALAKAKPKTMSYMAPSLSKVAFMEEINKKNGVDFVRVPFKGGGDAVNSMLSGTTPIAIFGIGNLIQFIRNGKILGFAVDGDKRSPMAPEIPTFKEVGYKEHLMATFFGIYAPTGTPKPIIDKFNKVIVQVASKPEFQKKHMDSRGLTAVLNSPEQFAKELDADRAEGLAVVKASGLYPNIK
jgi:tripartite-type tricarboxylate transporter receptor subunit TctC